MNATARLGLVAALLLLSSGAHSQTLQDWMAPEVKDAWNQGYKGQNVTIHIVDDFKSNERFYGDLGTDTLLRRHGEWVRLETKMIAPSAKLKPIDFNNTRAVKLARGLNVINLSYGMFAPNGYLNSQLLWDPQEASIISYAQNGAAVVVKAAGNDSVAVGAPNAMREVDYLNRALTGGQSTLFVGALNRNGSSAAPAQLAWYSNHAGNDPSVQGSFLVVGVEGHKTNLYGTSFAAPIVSGYAAILGSKFRDATPAQITNQLLNTARTDTLLNYNPATYGRGEASLTRALAPVSIK